MILILFECFIDSARRINISISILLGPLINQSTLYTHSLHQFHTNHNYKIDSIGLFPSTLFLNLISKKGETKYAAQCCNKEDCSQVTRLMTLNANQQNNRNLLIVLETKSNQQTYLEQISSARLRTQFEA
ncbi:hypothetical protein BpHYR1_048617 [Brachionus plicatilis]|uniref:Uncharacterized protein n=1 Tax=Brachionus plicatilis TaxID=10195 RepID=A0A3M7RLZ6_BRAPC|nr:hypothetical protein BpHYR1_048617 [Brachionus plicatilis]